MSEHPEIPNLPVFTGADLAQYREMFDMSQGRFAGLLGLSEQQIVDLEKLKRPLTDKEMAMLQFTKMGDRLKTLQLIFMGGRMFHR